jgi:hypothetical protein
MRERILRVLLATLLFCAVHESARAAENLSGTYTVQGAKGPVVLTLQSDEEGNLTGTLKGGDLVASLKGLPMEGGGATGTLRDPGGAVLSYFQVKREGNNLLFDYVPINGDGDPDLARKTRLATFPLGITNTAQPATASAFAGIFKDDALTVESNAESGAGQSAA